jgi:hypothetical protein
VRTFFKVVLACLLLMGGLALSAPVNAASTGNSAPHPDRIVSDDPAGFTPHVMNGQVLSLAQVGNMIIVGGTFSTVRNAGSTTDIPRTNVFAFNAATGQVSTSFAPNPNSTVYKVLPAADGSSVYLGGNFTQITSGGTNVSVSRLVKLSVATGTRDTGFSPGSFNGQVRDLELTGNRLWVAGKFSHIQGVAQRALGTLNATTGARDPYFTGVLAGTHRGLAGDITNVLAITTNPANNQLVAVGNFTSVNGQFREQIAKFDIGGTNYSLANWYTTLFESNCSQAFETYVLDVSYSPDGSFFAVATTGAYGGSAGSTSLTSGCDVVARFEANGVGTNVRPTWGTYTGGDTTWSVEVTDDVVYVGGHQRWQNNPTRGDAIGQGAVSRPGIAALSAASGVPYTWNPTRTLGVGVKDMLATTAGLFVGSDTSTFGGETHHRIAFLPLSSGQDLPVDNPHELPGDVFRVATGGSQLTRTGFDGTAVTSGPTAVANGPGWGTSVGAFMLNGTLYTAYSNGNFTKQTFDGTNYGPAIPVDTGDELARQTDWHDTDVPFITSLFYDRGHIFFTRSGQTSLFYRGFESESDIVGQLRLSTGTVPGINFSSMRGAFVADNKLYFANTSGQLFVADWNGFAPVAGSAEQLSSAGGGWASRAMFVYQGDELEPPGNVAPTAVADVACDQLTCEFDASDSTDSDGTIESYSWDFGDGEASDDVSPTHSYATAGPRAVTLTVTDDDGETGQTTRNINPSDEVSPVTFVAAASTTGNRTNHSVTVPASVQAGDQLVLFFTANSTTPSYSVPNGWTLEESRSGDGTVGFAYSRVATAADAGNTVAITSSGVAKDVVTVAAYRGGSVTATASELQTIDATARTTPLVNAADDQHWLVSYWSDKGSTARDWTVPGAVTQRAEAFGTSGGHIGAVLGDSNGAVASGSQGGVVATSSATTTAAVTFSVLIG